jgi:hypothetical protein
MARDKEVGNEKKGGSHLLGMLAAVVQNSQDLDLFASGG